MTKSAVCGAKTRAGGTCKQAAEPNGRCRFHGGKSLKGIASATFKHGRQSKYLPARMLEDYQRSLEDPEVLALGDEIALVDARLSDLLSRVDTGEAGAHWTKAQEQFNKLRRAASSGDNEKAQDAMRELDIVLGQAVADFAAWGEIGKTLEIRRRLVDSEKKRLVDMQLMMSVEQALTLTVGLGRSVRERLVELFEDIDAGNEVSLTKTLTDIQSDIDVFTRGGK